MILSIDDARALVHASMIAVGHTAAEANIIADHLIDCALRGLSYAGLPRADDRRVDPQRHDTERSYRFAAGIAGFRFT